MATQAVLDMTFNTTATQTNFISKGFPCFVNFSHKSITDCNPSKFPQSQLVFEILESCDIDGTLIATIRELRRKGFLIAFDDFQPTRSWLDILPLADIVKIDFSALSSSTILQLLRLIPKDRKCKLLAEKLENQAEVDQALSLGFDLFQGYALHRPENLSLSKAEASEAVTWVRTSD
ncbi:EAL domain-containing protein [Veronia pacifica]|nr:EAL domain-containing protein [Veronia pacifica]